MADQSEHFLAVDSRIPKTLCGVTMWDRPAAAHIHFRADKTFVGETSSCEQPTVSGNLRGVHSISNWVGLQIRPKRRHTFGRDLQNIKIVIRTISFNVEQ